MRAIYYNKKAVYEILTNFIFDLFCTSERFLVAWQDHQVNVKKIFESY